MGQRLRAPRGLGPAGRRLWQKVTADLILDAVELETAALAARTADIVAKIEGQMTGEPLTTAGSMGQVRAHPLLAELRQFRDLEARLLGRLRPALGDDGDDGALSRWSV